MEKKQYKEMHDVIIEECGRALDAIDADDVLRYIGMIQSAEKVFFVGSCDCCRRSGAKSDDLFLSGRACHMECPATV